MAKEVRAIVIAGNGTNCEREVANACRWREPIWRISFISPNCWPAGCVSTTTIFSISPAVFSTAMISAAPRPGQIVCCMRRLPAPTDIYPIRLRRFIAEGKLVMGVCNGFQLMVKMGLLPDPLSLQQSTTLTFNDGGRFIDTWVYLKADPTPPVFIPGESAGFICRYGMGRGGSSPRARRRWRKSKTCTWRR